MTNDFALKFAEIFIKSTLFLSAASLQIYEHHKIGRQTAKTHKLKKHIRLKSFTDGEEEIKALVKSR